ncbi:BTAD domain-containing putative transcriptional regulator [Streptomyces sp. NPDC052676]|uniref:BTAD domain-containing putative transcriptional regulator n=1 Tax=Streptomyces sp. NPDC052676 TaxID=3154953 RepID=UPI003422DF13
MLLLRANRVVATSELLAALWPEDNRPTTARKIVQNAVWGLRALFAEGGDDPHRAAPALVTQAPGYLLRVDPEHVDLHRFNQRVAEGRACLSAGRHAEAAALLGTALDEWRGTALADLAETGTDWPELTALSQLRLDVMEDRFEAELRSGRHHEILGELVSLAEEEPLRERLCGQLMLALYRCGRQAEALDVFSRVRRSLVEEHGLEPSRELQLLQQNILTHDLSLTPRAAAPVERSLPVHEPARSAAGPSGPSGTSGVSGPTGASRVPGVPGVPGSSSRPRTASDAPLTHRAAADRPAAGQRLDKVPPPAGAVRIRRGEPAPRTERRSVALLLVRTGFTDEAAAFTELRSSITLHDAVTAVAESVVELGGTLAGSLGYVSMAVFGLDGAGAGAGDGGGAGDGAAASFDAVLAAMELRARLSQLPGPTWHAVVAAGEVLVRRDPRDTLTPVTVVGRLVDEARSLLAAVQPGEILLSGDAVRHTAGRVRQSPHERSGVRVVAGLGADDDLALPDPPGDHGAELAVLKGLMSRTRRHDAPHLVTILGDPGTGKTRFLADFVRGIQGGSARVVRLRAGQDAWWTLPDLLRLCCGMGAADVAGDRLTEVVHRVAGHGTTAERLLRQIRAAEREREALDGWRDLLVLLAREQPLVLCLDDAHLADDAVLDLLEWLASEPQDAPLFMVVCARPELLERRPVWGSGLRHTGTLTLEGLPGVTDRDFGADWVREPSAPQASGGRATRR